MQVPFVKDSYRGEIPVNWYPAADTDKGVIMFGSPGLSEVYDCSGGTMVRCLKAAGDYLYAVVADENAATSTVYRFDQNFAAKTLGTINSFSDPVMAEYNGVQVAFCDGSTIYVYNIATNVFAEIADVDFPGASYLTYQDGYGVFLNPGTQQFYLTALYDFTDIDALDYASAEGMPDNLMAIMMNYREIWMFGEKSIEIWYNAGTSPFPFARVQGGYIEQGISAPYSVAKMDNMIYWLSNRAQVMVGMGYQPQIVSSRKMEREIEGYAKIDDAFGFSYVFEGHSFYQITFPTGGTTWVYDAATKMWHKRTSYPDQGRHRANCYAYFFGKHYVGDFENGKIYQMDSGSYDDNGEEIVRKLQSPEMRNEGKRQFFPGLQIYFDHGHGLVSGQGSNPQAMLKWSNDGGNTWSNEMWSPMGKMGGYAWRTIWRRLGSDYTRIFQLSVSDPVRANILEVNWI